MRYLPLLLLATACTTSIRPDSLTRSDAAREAEGRRWLARAADAHGGQARFDAVHDATAEATVEFVTLTGKWFVNAFAENRQKVRLDVLAGADDGRLTFLDGEDAGTGWGVQQWVTYDIAKSGALTFHALDDANADYKFWPPTMAYFLFMPFRIGEAKTVQHVGDRTVGGVEYAVVFATWGGLEPRADVDQYLLFIDKKTGILRWAEFTIRDSARFLSGAMHMTDHRAVGGLLIPHRLKTVGTPGDADTFSHEIEVERVQLDVKRPLDYYRPRPALRAAK